MVYTAVAAGARPSLALRSNGQVIAFGRPDAGQARVPPLGLFERYLAVAGGFRYSLAIKQSDLGSLPYPLKGLCPEGWSADGQTKTLPLVTVRVLVCEAC